MLSLTRDEKQSIIIEVPGLAQRIEVMVVSVSGKKVRVGIDAPKNCTVNRLEVQMRKDAEKGIY